MNIYGSRTFSQLATCQNEALRQLGQGLLARLGDFQGEVYLRSYKRDLTRPQVGKLTKCLSIFYINVLARFHY